jgi:hypothetical protein
MKTTGAATRTPAMSLPKLGATISTPATAMTHRHTPFNGIRK